MEKKPAHEPQPLQDILQAARSILQTAEDAVDKRRVTLAQEALVDKLRATREIQLATPGLVSTPFRQQIERASQLVHRLRKEAAEYTTRAVASQIALVAAETHLKELDEAELRNMKANAHKGHPATYPQWEAAVDILYEHGVNRHILKYLDEADFEKIAELIKWKKADRECLDPNNPWHRLTPAQKHAQSNIGSWQPPSTTSALQSGGNTLPTDLMVEDEHLPDDQSDTGLSNHTEHLLDRADGQLNISPNSFEVNRPNDAYKSIPHVWAAGMAVLLDKRVDGLIFDIASLRAASDARERVKLFHEHNLMNRDHPSFRLIDTALATGGDDDLETIFQGEVERLTFALDRGDPAATARIQHLQETSSIFRRYFPT